METYWCQYATDWAEIKDRWELTMTDPEAEAVVEMLGTCEDPPDVEVEVEGWEALRATAGIPEGEGPVRAGRGRGWSGVRAVKSFASGHNATADPWERKRAS